MALCIFAPEMSKFYSIIDIEATGGNSKIGRITEVAIYLYDGREIVKEYNTLVNPERSIPIYVQRLTGITDKMVATAPLFADVADDIADFLNGSCFVAHNVKSDYSFIKDELQKAGIEFTSESLCTLELSKTLIPEASHHGLGKICKHLEIEVPNRHRASGDALATVKLFQYLQSVDSADKIQRLIRKA
tara:strand:- start:20924 stop:21490 length:567 start_codon:yes stop_codon:yes gene_type:complete